MARIYHITSAPEAEAATRTGEYLPRAFAADGFIHCSRAEQVAAVANAFYRGCDDLVLLEIDRERIPCKVVDEYLDGGRELFAHVYGPLPMSVVVAVHALRPDTDGRFELPAAVPRT